LLHDAAHFGGDTYACPYACADAYVDADADDIPSQSPPLPRNNVVINLQPSLYMRNNRWRVPCEVTIRRVTCDFVLHSFLCPDPASYALSIGDAHDHDHDGFHDDDHDHLADADTP